MDYIEQNIKRWLPFLAIVSVMAYTSAISLQFGYYSSFGIDLFTFTPRLDPTSLSSIFIVVFFGIFIILFLKVMRFVQNSNSLKTSILSDVGVIGLILITILLQYIFKDSIDKNGLPGTYTNYILASMGLLVVALRAVSFFLYKKRMGKTVSTRQAIIATSVLKRPYANLAPKKKSEKNDANDSKKYVAGFLTFAELTVLVLTVVLVMPFAFGTSLANSRNDFPEIVENDSDSELRKIVIGLSPDGYVIKQYNTKSDKYEDGWEILKSDQMTFKISKVKSLEEQR